MEKITIRPWTEQDIDIVTEMEARCFSDPWNKEAMTASYLAPFTHCFLLEAGGQVCGYCILSVLFEDAEVLNIAVDLPHRKQGYGNALMNAMHEKAIALGAEKCFLEVRESNLSAITLYKKYGYEQYGVRKRYYEDGEDALAMKKTL
ncbi:MAG: ribosomal protein S18-alanine N-acetyltransferase [Clostridia bacterium]|nr:ribosomal protein S18-alanine N-acetyltransferase [Clostridia bacterium]